MAKQRNTRKRQTFGGNSLRKRLVNCIKDILTYLACSSDYGENEHINNGQLPNMSRLRQRFLQLKNIDEAIEDCTEKMLALPAYQTLLAGSNIMQKTYGIIEWYGLHAYYSLQPGGQMIVRQKILQCTTVEPLTTTLVAASRNPVAKQALTAENVEMLRDYLNQRKI